MTFDEARIASHGALHPVDGAERFEPALRGTYRAGNVDFTVELNFRNERLEYVTLWGFTAWSVASMSAATDALSTKYGPPCYTKKGERDWVAKGNWIEMRPVGGFKSDSYIIEIVALDSFKDRCPCHDLRCTIRQIGPTFIPYRGFGLVADLALLQLIMIIGMIVMDGISAWRSSDAWASFCGIVVALACATYFGWNLMFDGDMNPLFASSGTPTVPLNVLLLISFLTLVAAGLFAAFRWSALSRGRRSIVSIAIVLSSIPLMLIIFFVFFVLRNCCGG